MSEPSRNRASTGHASDEELLASALPIDETEDETQGTDDAPAAGAAADQPDDDDDAIELDDAEADTAAEPGSDTSSKIKLIGDRGTRQDKPWQRQPNQTGQGAVHVKTFLAKFRTEAIEHLEQQINDWLEAHPEYEVKFVTTDVGALKGKMTEDAIVVNVWV